jgi:hypothetical protein
MFRALRREEKMKKKPLVCIVVLLLIVSTLSPTFIAKSVSVSETIPSIIILSPQSKIYTVNDTIPLTFTISKSVFWIGYSLNRQPNVTITENMTLPGLADGWHSIVIYANDSSGKVEASAVRNFTIDTIAPTGSVTINGGAFSTMSTQVTLTISAEDATSGVAQMHFFYYNYTDWEDYATSKNWEFQAGDGIKYIYVQFRDNAGLVSGPYRDDIFLGYVEPSEEFASQSHLSYVEPSEEFASQSHLSEIPDEVCEEMPEEPLETGEDDVTIKPPEEEKPEFTVSPFPAESTVESYFSLETPGIIVTIAIVGVVIVLMRRKH